MGFDVLRKRRKVTVLPVAGWSEDEYGNPVPVPGIPFDTWASREQLKSTEEVLGRDQQARTFRYFFGSDVTVSGRDQIRDGGNVLNIIGEPEIIHSAVAPHHLELMAELVEG